MKKNICLLAIMLASLSAVNAQISITGGGSTKAASYIAKDTHGHVSMYNDAYCIRVKDVQSAQTLTVVLGTEKAVAIETINALKGAFDNLKNKEYIEFEDAAGNQLIMYKSSGNPVFSDGDAEYVKNYIRNQNMKAMFGAAVAKRQRENDPMIGTIKANTLFEKAIVNLEKE